MADLFSPLTLAHGPALKNRFMLAPLTNLQSHPDGTLSDDEFKWLTLRAKELPDSIIDDALAQGLNARIETKYWMEQMGMPFHPTHVNVQNQKERRHGYADLLRYPQRYRVLWRLWSGGTTRLLSWADADYVRRFAESARLYGGDAIDVNEMLATRMLGEPHEKKPGPLFQPGAAPYEYDFERYWPFYLVWGRVSYNPRTPAAARSRKRTNAKRREACLPRWRRTKTGLAIAIRRCGRASGFCRMAPIPRRRKKCGTWPQQSPIETPPFRHCG